MVTVGQTGVTVNASVVEQPFASVAFTVKVAAVVLLGMPLSTPSGLSVAHEGKVPLASVKV